MNTNTWNYPIKTENQPNNVQIYYYQIIEMRQYIQTA